MADSAVLDEEEGDYNEEEDEDYAASDAGSSESEGSDSSDDGGGGGKRKRKRRRVAATAAATAAVDGSEASDLLADAREYFGDAFMVEAKAKAARLASEAECQAMWEDLVADDSAYVSFKMAAAGRLGGAQQQAQPPPPLERSVAALRSVVIPGFGRTSVTAAARAHGDGRQPLPARVDALMLNAVRGGAALPIENGPTCVVTGGGARRRARSSDGDGSSGDCGGRRAGHAALSAALAGMLAPLAHEPAAYSRARATALGASAASVASSLAGRDVGELLATAAAAKAIAANKKVAVVQSVKFAGKTMTVTRLVTPGTRAAQAVAEEATQAAARAAIASAARAGEAAQSGDGAAAAPGSAAGGGSAAAAGGGVSLDDLLSNLDKPEAISTLTKSSLDWDTYKHAHGLDDELERATKGGFVDKQAFLARVDDRKHELEREQRGRERSRAELAAMQQRR